MNELVSSYIRGLNERKSQNKKSKEGAARRDQPFGRTPAPAQARVPIPPPRGAILAERRGGRQCRMGSPRSTDCFVARGSLRPNGGIRPGPSPTARTGRERATVNLTSRTKGRSGCSRELLAGAGRDVPLLQAGLRLPNRAPGGRLRMLVEKLAEGHLIGGLDRAQSRRGDIQFRPDVISGGATARSQDD